MLEFDMSKKQIDVAIGLLFSKQQVLVGWREAKQHQGNKYEFPGGKVEDGENPKQACRREIDEEVGICIDEWFSWDTIRHEYDDLIVSLHLFFGYVPEEKKQNIKLPWQWYDRTVLNELNFPKANDSIINRLALSKYIQIASNICEEMLSNRLIYWRNSELESILERDLSCFILNQTHVEKLKLAQKKQLAAIHLKEQQLMNMQKGDLEVGISYIAACHSEKAVQHAQRIGCDAVFLSPVCLTTTHSEAVPLGWEQFKNIASKYDVLVYALGGISPHDLNHVEQCGGYGVAGISAFTD